jgi:hypothetical protein
VTEAQNLNDALACWVQDLPGEWQFSTHCIEAFSETTSSDFWYNDTVYSYTTHGHAAVWIRFLAVRIIVSSILLKLLSALPQEPTISKQVESMQQLINLLATDMCCTVPFFFTSNALHHQFESSTFNVAEKMVLPEILPKIATLLSWPLSIAVSTNAVPAKQKEWLKHKLKIAASVQGDAVVQSIAESEEFKF